MQKSLITVVLFTYFVLTPRVFANSIIFYGSHSGSYQTEILQHALSYLPEKHYQIVNFSGQIPKQRAFDFMNAHQELDVIFGGATINREQQGLAIRIPLLKGLNGWRLPLVHKKTPEIFKNINTLAQFKQLVPGQFHSWSDTKVLESNGIRVEKGSDFEGLFLMLAKQRFDYFPRSILEVFRELNARENLDITIDNSVLIYYPTAYYFYVAHDNEQLAQDITTGLEQAIADGSFDAIFTKHFSQPIEQISAIKRKVFFLNNPYLPEKTPLSRKELWLHFPAKSEIIQ
ncbi:hypothetical protein tinsulaeT_26150 [Thalassotalea insulae]|uniref:Solute-binding protein family 3/N-terminal domain-containing protein n=1 Tax=Thalassotalea insulae TaxID=2056778 RepID=A0ABQ6GTK2_9GAMM|nr:transporter substrate-binding domain-containing protein [Thalassotalea insulae]GLX79275.1 hypothetical protein tinsulaeT_26150 [Thalassotalea insulae]